MTEMTLSPDKRRILLVDDDTHVLSKVSGFLFRSGAWEVWQAHTGARAMELWAEHKEQINVLITDVDLPDTSGLELANRLRADKMSLYVLFISGHPRNIGNAGNRFKVLSKPFTAGDVVNALRVL